MLSQLRGSANWLKFMRVLDKEEAKSFNDLLEGMRGGLSTIASLLNQA